MTTGGQRARERFAGSTACHQNLLLIEGRSRCKALYSIGGASMMGTSYLVDL